MENNDQTNVLLLRIVVALEALAQASAPAEPNYRYPLAEYGRFDWSSINAQVIAHDRSGATAVQWSGHTWTRRSGDGKFGKAIWFSRPNGQDEEGAIYLRLVTFKDLSAAEPLSASVTAAAPRGAPKRPAQVTKNGDDTDILMKPNPAMLKAFDAAGSALYGDEWPQKQLDLVAWATKERNPAGTKLEVKHLSRDEMQRCIDGMKAKADAQ